MEHLTKEAWSRMSGKEQWDIQVALRGPDSFYGETVKWYTTAVIRGKVQEVMRVGGTVNNYLNLVILPGHGSIVDKKKRDWNCGHFVEHVQLAAHHLKIPCLTIPNELWHETMRMTSAHHAGVKIYAVVAEHPSKYGPEVIAALSKHLELGSVFS